MPSSLQSAQRITTWCCGIFSRIFSSHLQLSVLLSLEDILAAVVCTISCQNLWKYIQPNSLVSTLCLESEDNWLWSCAHPLLCPSVQMCCWHWVRSLPDQAGTLSQAEEHWLQNNLWHHCWDGLLGSGAASSAGDGSAVSSGLWL